MQFKKILFAIYALIFAVLWAPQAQAIPAFARQVGMACSACHYQHFPVLNSFGRAFKEGGYTMTGAQEKIEGDGLSIPNTLNLAVVMNMQYQKTNGDATIGSDGLAVTPTTKTTNHGAFDMTQASLFLGGRIAENIGFVGELGMYPAPAGLASIKMPFIYDVGSAKVGVVPFTTNGLGVAHSFEVMSTGAVAVHLFNQQDMTAISAQQYIGTATAASGAALVVSNDMGYINFAKWSPNEMTSGNGSPTSTYLRIAATPGNLIPGFDFAAGAQFWRGTSASSAAKAGTQITTQVACSGTSWTPIPGGGLGTCFGNFGISPDGRLETEATAIDAQMMGDVGGMPLTLIASYAVAPGEPGGSAVQNMFNNDANNAVGETKKSFNMAAEFGVIPNKATLQFGIRRASSGQFANDPAITNMTDNAILVGATYALAMNVRAELTYSKYSGSMYNAGEAAMLPGGKGNSLTTFNLWAGF
jgi:hypothetical protein